MRFDLLSWNVGGVPKGISSTSFDEIKPHLDGDHHDVLCLQEIYDVEEKLRCLTGFDAYDVVSSWDTSATNRNVHNTVVATRHGVDGFGHVGFDDIGYDTGSVVWADVDVGEELLRVYSARLEVGRVGMRGRLAMIRKVLRHASGLRRPVVVAGDMNTTIPGSGLGRVAVKLVHRTSRDKQVVDGERRVCDERYVFAGEVSDWGFQPVLDVESDTWAFPHTSLEYPSLKLDWVLRRGLRCVDAWLGGYVSDHRPVHAVFEIGS